MNPHAGMHFTHKHELDTTWQPGPGQRYTDAPKLECVVTMVTATTVYYRALSSAPGRARIDLPAFIAAYCDGLSQ